MPRNLRRSLAGAVAVLALAAPASAQTTEPYVPNTPLTSVYLSCEGGQTKEWFVNSLLFGQYATWAETAPASVTTGAGCGFFEDVNFSGTRPRTPYDFTFSGTYTGNLDALNVTLHMIGVGGITLNDQIPFDVRMTIDGISMFGIEENAAVNGTISTSPATETISVPVQATGATGAVAALPFSVRGIDLLLEGDDVEHTIEFTVAPAFDLTLTEGEFVWGASEAPSGVVVNPEAAGTAVLKADRRSTRKAVTI